jgi:hypothetical protein
LLKETLFLRKEVEELRGGEELVRLRRIVELVREKYDLGWLAESRMVEYLEMDCS